MRMSSSYAARAAWWSVIPTSPDALDSLMKKIGTVKPADVTAYAKKYLHDETRTTVVFEAPSAGGGK